MSGTRQRRMVAGVCVTCGVRDAHPGIQKCRACADKANAKARADRAIDIKIREGIRAAGLCTNCTIGIQTGDGVEVFSTNPAGPQMARPRSVWCQSCADQDRSRGPRVFGGCVPTQGDLYATARHG